MAIKLGRKDFLDALFGEYLVQHKGFIRVRTVKSLEKRVSTRFFPKTELLAKEQFPDDQDIFFGVCPHENMKPDKASIRYLCALWAGLDLATDGYSGTESLFPDLPTAAKAIRSFPVPPSIVVESGRGFHLYWLLTKVTEINDYRRIESFLGSLNAFFRCKREIPIDTCLRLPETTNCKIGNNSVNSRIKYINVDFRYALADFENLNVKAARPVSPPPAALAKAVAAARTQSPPAAAGHTGRPSVPLPAARPASQPPPPPPAAEVSRPSPAPKSASDALPSFEQFEETYSEAVVFSHSQVQGFVSNEWEPPEETGFDESEAQRASVPLDESDMEDTSTGPDSMTVKTAGVSVAERLSGDTMTVFATASPDSLADEIVERVVTQLTDQFMEKLVDQIVERLYQRLVKTTPRR